MQGDSSHSPGCIMTNRLCVFIYSRRSAIFKKGSWKRVPNNNQIVFMYYIQNLQKNCQKLHIGYSKANYFLLHKNGGKIVQFKFGEV